MWFLLVALGFAYYVQFSPTMGHIWLRRDDKNQWVFVPANLWHLMCAPLHTVFFWYPPMWSINVFVWWMVGYLAWVALHTVWDASVVRKRGGDGDGFHAR